MAPRSRSGLATEVGTCKNPFIVKRGLDQLFDIDWLPTWPLENLAQAKKFFWKKIQREQ